MRVLEMQKRGGNFRSDYNGKSDVNNWRICTPNECIRGKDGKTYFLEFSYCETKYTWRSTNKRTGERLKKSVREITAEEVLRLDTQYTDSDGLSWRNSKLEAEIFSRNLLYTLDNILSVVNEISVDKYDRIVFVD